MITPKEFRQLKAGTRVQWREPVFSPRAGQISAIGTVHKEGPRQWVIWPDGQETESFDDWALRNIEVAQ